MSNVTPFPRARRGPAAPKRPPRLRFGIVVVVVIVVAVLVVVLSRYYIDWLWFGEVDLRVVFWRRIWTSLVVGIVFGAVFFAILYSNIEVARRLAPRFRAFEGVDLVEPVHERAQRLARLVGLGVSIVLGIIVGAGSAGSWLTFLRAFNGVDFGVSDPVFGRDVGFYVFELPLWQYVYSFLFGSLIATLVITVITHLVLGGVVIEQEQAAGEGVGPRARRVTGVRIERGALAHVSVLLAAIFVVAGFGYILRAWELLFSSSGVVFGAGYTDLHARLWAIRILMVLAWVIAAALIANVWWRRRLLPVAAVGVWIAGLVVLLGIWPAITQALVVNPNEGSKEAPYIERNIEATRAAYNLDVIEETAFPLKGDLTAAKLAVNQATLRNIRLWDPGTLVRSYRQLQELRPYYSFVDADVDRYDVNGTYRQTMLSARELNITGLPQQSQTWVNQHITYTHGFGVTLSAVNQVASDGSPDFLVQDIPVTSSAPSLRVAEPRIYYGEIGTDYTLVKTKEREFDYPGGNGDEVYRPYSGSGGVPIGSFLNRTAFNIRFGTIKFWTASAIDDDSRIIIRNNIMARLTAAAPFLTFDRDPYMVIADGRLFWIADAYTTTALYPYSERQGSLNYLRNSVKAVIDAYNGTMTLYNFSPDDPIIGTYEKIFPGMFKPLAEMPSSLMKHVRYPEDYFKVQAELLTTYHVTDPAVVYNKGDQWQVPSNVSISGSGQMEPYYVIMRLPGQEKEEFVLILPYVPNGRPNMIAWLGGQSDPPSYGKGVSFGFPSNLSVYGPAQVEAAINQDPVISAQRTLWGQEGSTVIFGNLLVVPIEDSLLYVQPLYLESQQTQLPQLQRIIVFYRSPQGGTLPNGETQAVVMAPTLGEALTEIFGASPDGGEPTPEPGQPTPPAGEPPTQLEALIERANQQFEAAQAALRAGDFAEYGRQIDALEQTLSQLRSLP